MCESESDSDEFKLKSVEKQMNTEIQCKSEGSSENSYTLIYIDQHKLNSI